MSNKTITFRLSSALLKNIKLAAKTNNRNPSILVRDFIVYYLGSEGVVWSRDLTRKFPDESNVTLNKKLTVLVEDDVLTRFSEKLIKNKQEASEFIRSACRSYVDKNG